MSSQRDRQLQEAREMDRASTALIRFGKTTVQRNPIKVGLYVLGVMICLLFSGFTVNDTQRAEYNHELEKMDTTKLHVLRDLMQTAQFRYSRSKGWFTCDTQCKGDRDAYNFARKEFEIARAEEDQKLFSAKSKLGLFSEYGVEETRNLFWERFAQGKNFAKRQTTWDLIFFGIGAMSRDETMLSYALRVVVSMLFNFTLGVFGAVVAFVFSLGYLIQTYQASFFVGIFFFLTASIAAISFAMTWLVALYGVAAAGTYVSLKLIASNMRIEGGENNQSRSRVRYNA